MHNFFQNGHNSQKKLQTVLGKSLRQIMYAQSEWRLTQLDFCFYRMHHFLFITFNVSSSNKDHSLTDSFRFIYG